jgi:hypothetical protein
MTLFSMIGLVPLYLQWERRFTHMITHLSREGGAFVPSVTNVPGRDLPRPNLTVRNAQPFLNTFLCLEQIHSALNLVPVTLRVESAADGRSILSHMS